MENIESMATEILAGERLSWMKGAPCVGHGHLFFGPHREGEKGRRRREHFARQICQTCDAMQECRQYARDAREQGYWGGEGEEARERAIRLTRGA